MVSKQKYKKVVLLDLFFPKSNHKSLGCLSKFIDSSWFGGECDRCPIKANLLTLVNPNLTLI
ncbi:hypothetical protein H6G76_01075 [Nostoc sp. FACHB-152]|uniref:hypothetical protein n=1 Tax=unclassified Nostoc TaxID=2593658 RepID=UPI0016830750|nr:MULTISPECIES: hypothetical protein [unclassified Nostoc]MBD2445762.1 hypothetical protein [Nostoc sp. FACHB-152]MBD2466876.1 hypothetical protein [Nostoc sp. FACHB-145]